MAVLNNNIMMNVCVDLLLSMILTVAFVNSMFWQTVQKKRASKCFTLWAFFRIMNMLVDGALWFFSDRNIPTVMVNILFFLYIYTCAAIYIFASGWALYLITDRLPVNVSIKRLESYSPLLLLLLALGFCLFSGMSYYDVLFGGKNSIFITVIKISEVVYLLFTAGVIFKYRRALVWYETVLIMAIFVVPIFLIWQNLWIHIPSAIFGTMSILLIYVLVWLRRRKEIYRHERKIASVNALLSNSRMDVMISQIQPHFLYNSLSAIAGLCSVNPEKAHEITVSFKEYLRGNLSALKQSEPIDFSDELRHIEAYLNIEKARFEERLNVAYDIKATNFKVPILSLQVLVENAVKHGICERVSGGTVTISSKENEIGWTVIIKDDGVGFDTEKKPDDNRAHIGIENARERLEIQCGGTLNIVSEKGVGTIAAVLIPKKGRPEN